MSDDWCVWCGNEGQIQEQVVVSVMVCCGCPTPSGECCGNGVQGQDIEIRVEACPHCEGKNHE